MRDPALLQQTDQAAPPPPYRVAPWFDPQVEHQPCQCPRCRGLADSRPPRRIYWRTSLVVGGGVVLPAVSLLVNASMNVVSLGLGGTLAILLSMVSALLHVIFSPVRKQRQEGLPVVKHDPPRSSAMRMMLLGLSAASCLICGYLAILFLPLVPLSAIGIIYLGIGLCGLSPYGALAIALIQIVRDYRAARDASGEKRARRVLLATLATPIVLAVGAGTLAYIQRAEVDAALSRIEQLPEGSAARYRQVAALAGKEQALVDAFLRPTQERRALIAATYRHLTDETLDRAVAARPHPDDAGVIRPFAFLEGCSPVSDRVFRWRF